MCNERLLVTGGAGFLGRTLLQRLSEKRDREIHVIDNFSFGARECIPDVPNINVIECDVRDRRTTLAAISRVDCEVAVHLAAIHFIPYCNAHPDEAYAVNVVGTKNVLDSLMGMRSLKRVLFASTMAVYGISEDLHTESDDVNPVDAYGWSKAVGEDLADRFGYAKGVPVVKMRFSNIVGPGETNMHLVPEIGAQIAAGAKELKLGNLEPKRNYVHVSDVADFLEDLMTAELVSAATTVNIGSREELGVSEIVRLFSDATGQEIAVVSDPERRRKVDRMRLQPDLVRLISIVGHEPRHTVSEAVRDVLVENGVTLGTATQGS